MPAADPAAPRASPIATRSRRLRRQRRMLAVAAVLGLSGAAVGLTLAALGEGLDHFHVPADLAAGGVDTSRTFRLGGLVVHGSVRPLATGTAFELSDGRYRQPVAFTGPLPSLFREGQGIIATGRLGETGVVEADQLLAKHDETYMPPELADRLAATQDRAAMAAAAATLPLALPQAEAEAEAPATPAAGRSRGPRCPKCSP